MIVIGLGSGRSGTASLSKFLNSQYKSHCFHELNPSCISFKHTKQPVINTINEFQAILDGGDPSMLTVDMTRRVSVESHNQLLKKDGVDLIGDIAHYYLSYVEMIAEINDNVRFICLKRDKQKTVESWLKKTEIKQWFSKRLAERLTSLITRTPFYKSTNHWIAHDGSKWKKDTVWDKCFPKFETDSKRDAIEIYWEYYYNEADRLEKKLKDVFMIVNIERLNTQDGQAEILNFCGIPPEKHFFVSAHIHKSKY